jgi:hypothetical protein
MKSRKAVTGQHTKQPWHHHTRASSFGLTRARSHRSDDRIDRSCMANVGRSELTKQTEAIFGGPPTGVVLG